MPNSSKVQVASNEVPAVATSVIDNAQSREFLLIEFQSLRNEIDLQISERRKIESQLLVGTALFYSWLLTKNAGLEALTVNRLLYLPIVAVFLGFIRWAALMLTVMNLGKYVKSSERKLADGQLGWEHYLADRRKQVKVFGNFEGWSGIVFWAFLQAITVVALFVFWK